MPDESRNMPAALDEPVSDPESDLTANTLRPEPSRSEAESGAPMPPWLIAAIGAVVLLGLGFASGMFGDRRDDALPATATDDSVVQPLATAEPPTEEPSPAPETSEPEIDTEPDDETPDDTEAPDPAPVVDDDANFLSYLALESSTFSNFLDYPDDRLIHLAKSLCIDLGNGEDPYALAFQVSQGMAGPDPVEAAAFVGAAMGTYCPQHQSGF